MSNYSLASYALRVKDKITKSNIRISDTSSGFDILEVFKAYLHERQAGLSLDPMKQKLLRVSKLEETGRELSGIIETGVYGHESDLLDVDVMEVTHVRQESEAELIPFYFLMSFPTDTNEGIIILQRFKTFGIRKILLDDFRDYLEAKNATFTVLINPLTYADIIRKYLTEGNLKKIRFVSHTLPSDLTRVYEEEGHDETQGTVELVVKARRNKALPVIHKIYDFLDGKGEVNDIIELEDFEYDTIKCEVEINGVTRTVDLSRPTKIRSFHDVSGKVKTERGHPIYSSIDYAGRDLLNDLLAEMREVAE
jgi:hypothetical protein